MRIYVASLADYNAGNLHGIWIDLDGSDEETIQNQVRAMLTQSKYPTVVIDCWECDGKGEQETGIGMLNCNNCKGAGKIPSAEEWAIHDYEMEGIKISESESFEDCLKISEAFEEHGEKFVIAYQNFGDVAQAITACEEDYQGVHRTLEDWAESYADDTGLLSSVPENLRFYFDWEKFARDCEIGGDIWSASGFEGIHVFHNR
jgi:antirestriction protein